MTLAVSVTSADASIAFNLLWSASVNTLLSDALSTNARISAAVWSAVAPSSTLIIVLTFAAVSSCTALPAPSSFPKRTLFDETF